MPKHSNYLKILCCNNPEFKKHYELALAYFEKNTTKFLAVAKKMDKEKSIFKSWFIFKRMIGQADVDKYLND